MKYSHIYIFDAVIDFENCYLREATCVFEPVRNEINLSAIGGKEIVVGYPFTVRFREYIKEINRGYNFDMVRIEI